MERVKQPISAESAEQKREITLSPEKEAEYKELLERAEEQRFNFWYYGNKLVMPPVEFDKTILTMPRDERLKVVGVRDLQLRFYEEGEPFNRFLINQMNQDLNTGLQSVFYDKLQVFKSLPMPYSGKILTKWLDDERIWNCPDGSNAHNILEVLEKTSEKGNEKIISAIERYIQNTQRSDYFRREFKDSDACTAVRSLVEIEGRDGINRLQCLCSLSPHLNEWFLHNLSCLERYVEDAERTRVHRQEARGFDTSRISEVLEQNKKKLEQMKEKEKRERFEFQQILIRGSAVLAQVLNKNKKLVRDIDIFLLKSGGRTGFEVQEFKNIEEARALFSENDFQKIKEWFKDSEYLTKPVHIVTTTEQQLRENDVYVEEPELVLFDRDLELLSKIYRPISQKEYEDLYKESTEKYTSEKYTSLRASTFSELGTALRNSLETGKYSSGKLIRGKAPAILYPNGTLDRALRTADIGKRFEIPVDDILLRNADKAVSNGSILLSVKPKEILEREIMAERLTAAQRYGLGHQGRPAGEIFLDEPFMKVVSKKEQLKILKQKYPRLGTLIEKIQEAGGLENFIEKKYGKVYLQRGGAHLYDVDLAKSPASISEQIEFLKLWDSYVEKSVHFPFKDVQKNSEEVEFPKSEEVQSLIDKNLLRSMLRGRFASHLTKALGTYEIKLDKALSIGVQKKLKALLGIFHLCWVDAIKDTKANLTTQLIKLGVHPRNPILSELDETKEHSVNLVITDNPEAILGASTDKPWTSCIQLKDGAYSESPYEDVKNGSVIAYLLKGKNFIGRVILRPTETLEEDPQIGPKDAAAGMEKYYGDERYNKALIEALKKILDEKGIDYRKTSISIKSYPNAWTDNATKDRTSRLIYRSGE